MNIRPIVLFTMLVGLLLTAGPSSGETGSLDHSPAEIVKRYVTLDQKGARLDSLSSEALAPYTDWHDEPAWGHMVLIRSATVAEQYRAWDVIDRLDVAIPVTFQVLGSVYFETASFVPDPGIEEVRMRVKSVRNRWRIVEPLLPPHVGQKRMVNFIREALVKEQDPMKRERLAALLDEVRKAK
ncbi:MAG TPA: hypothetical protein VFS39_08570 [Nitrospira sp.]|nr:hypothetical protein [Nitrospira sp.]